ncbi:MAG: hypothetical protein BGO55_00520 [Sphingobacteriales bacterium 50-39]|nr:hypothetical protein [Sphingobacteriales bacterium]OJW53598.1 MAG: hypothetical protein BGO55_00520 [Sphingobacteriales bacterium 50-39]
MKIFKSRWGLMLIVAILFTACGQHYNTEPDGRYPELRGKFRPVTDSLLQLERAGYTHIDRTVDGNPLIQDYWLRFEATWWQAKEWAEEDHTYKWFWLLAFLGPAAGIGAGKAVTMKRPAQWWMPLLVFIVWAVIWVGAYCVLDSKRWRTHLEVKQITFDSVMKADQTPAVLWKNVVPL